MELERKRKKTCCWPGQTHKSRRHKADIYVCVYLYPASLEQCVYARVI
jgi:hypothetical protein